MALELGLAESTEIYAFERLRYADGEPLALMRNYVPSGIIELTREGLEVHGLYDLLRASRINLRIAKQAIGARAASPPKPGRSARPGRRPC